MLKLIVGIGVLVLLLATIPISYMALENGCSLQQGRDYKNSESADISKNHAAPDEERAAPTATFNLSIAEPGKIDGRYYAKDTEWEKGNWARKFWCDSKIGEFTLTFFTLFLVCFTGGLWWSTNNLWRVTNDTLKHADITAKRELRAYVGLKRSDVTIRVVCPDCDLATSAVSAGPIPRNNFRMFLKNYGKTPAYRAYCCMGFKEVAIGSPLPKEIPDAAFRECDANQNKILISTIWPEEERPYQMHLFEEQVRIMRNVRARKSDAFLFGRIEYVDIFERKHHSYFCYQYIHGGGHGFGACSTDATPQDT